MKKGETETANIALREFPWLTTAQVAERKGCWPRTVQYAIERGDLRHVAVGTASRRMYLIHEDDADAWTVQNKRG